MQHKSTQAAGNPQQHHQASKKEEGMSYVCPNPDKYNDGQWHGESRECVALVKVACGAPRTTYWRKGMQVKNNGASIRRGTAIATFSNGSYEGHAAIYLSQDSSGIHVVDQWRTHPASTRVIRWGGNGTSNDGNQFYVVL